MTPCLGPHRWSASGEEDGSSVVGEDGVEVSEEDG